MSTKVEMANGDFGKHFASMYEGSMAGSGALVFAVMGYVIAKARPQRDTGEFYVDLNPVILGAILGEKPGAVEKAIERLSGPDARTRTPGNDGRRLKQVGQFTYWVVNGRKYRELGAREARMRQNREAQRRHREKNAGKPLVGEPKPWKEDGETPHELMSQAEMQERKRNMECGEGL